MSEPDSTPPPVPPPDPAAAPTTGTGARRRPRSRLVPIAVVVAAALLGAVVGGAAMAATGGDGGDASRAELVADEHDDATSTTADPSTSSSAPSDDSGDSGGAHDDHAAPRSAGSERADNGCLTVTDSSGGVADQEGADAFYTSVVDGIDRFEDLSVAESAGYVQVASTGQPDAERIRHYMRRGGANGAALDPENPSGLMYWVEGDEAVLLGAVWVTADADPPQPGGSLTTWHDHHQCGCPVNHPDCPAVSGAPANPPKMFHVWTFEGVQDTFSHDFMGALPEGQERGAPMPWE